MSEGENITVGEWLGFCLEGQKKTPRFERGVEVSMGDRLSAFMLGVTTPEPSLSDPCCTHTKTPNRCTL